MAAVAAKEDEYSKHEAESSFPTGSLAGDVPGWCNADQHWRGVT